MIKKSILLLLSISFLSFAKIQFNHTTGRYSSSPQSIMIREDEYNNLIGEIELHVVSKPLTETTWIEIATYLRMVGTPTALRLLSDLQEVLMLAKKEAKNLQKLLK